MRWAGCPPPHPNPLSRWGRGDNLGWCLGIQQHQQFEFTLGGAAADDCGRQVAGAVQQMAVALLQSNYCPADIRQHLPEPYPLRIEAAARGVFVGAAEK